MASTLADSCIMVTGGAGFLGKAVVDRLARAGVKNIVVPRSASCDLTRQEAVSRLFSDHAPDIVIHLAADVGGIGANKRHPGRFFYGNMAMGLHLIEAARMHHVRKFVQIGSVCSYPRDCPTPFSEDDLWNGFPEETNSAYGVAKRALAVMLDAYRREFDFASLYLIPVNLYGPGDSFDIETSHVIPGMIRRFCDAVDAGHDVVECWGSGTISREFLYVEDAAEAIVLATSTCDEPGPINLGTGKEIRVDELARMIARLCRFEGRIEWNGTRPDGQPRRCLDTTRASRLLNWQARVDLEDGLRRTIDWWREGH